MAIITIGNRDQKRTVGILNENVDLNFVGGSRNAHFNDPQVTNVLLNFNIPPKPYCVAFTKGRADKRELLPNGTVLWKITGHQLLGSPKTNTRTSQSHITEWWLPEYALAVVKHRCVKLGIALDDYAVARLAVDLAWNNPMTDLLVARLSRPVYAFTGETKYQPLDSSKSRAVLLIGGDIQHCVPDLTTAHICQVAFTPVAKALARTEHP